MPFWEHIAWNSSPIYVLVFDASSRREKKELTFLAIKMQGANRSGEGGGRRARCVTPDLSYE